LENGLARLVAYDKPDFIGREAALRDREAAPGRRLVLLDVDAYDAEANILEPVWLGNDRAGFVTSAAYGHTCGKTLAMSYVATPTAVAGTSLHVTIVGDRRACRVLGEPAVDPAGSRIRA
jgi:dimethylglycine dehydrogenase